MDKIDQRARRDHEDRLDRLPPQDHQLSSYPTPPAQALLASRNGTITTRVDGPSSGYSLMVAGQATGKTAFLRLLLDTSDIAPTTSQDQLASVAKFVQGCAGHTSHIRTVSFDIELDPLDNSQHQSITLTLTDTPSLDVRDEVTSERLVSDILRHVETKFSESLDDVRCTHLSSQRVPLLTRPYRSTRLGQAIITSTCMLPIHSCRRLHRVPFPCTHRRSFLHQMHLFLGS